MQNKVTMYVCGITAYDYSHIGHARAYVCYDVLYRHLTRLGYDVTYVRNFGPQVYFGNHPSKFSAKQADTTARTYDAFLMYR